MREVRQPLWDQRWELEAVELKRAQPEVFDQIMAFANSKGGAEKLAAFQIPGRPFFIMSVGIAKLWEMTENSRRIGKEAAERTYASAYDEWSRYGSTPDAAFLERFAELCLDQAARRSADQAARPRKKKAAAAK
ncbi:MAG: hypothetical protein AB7V46_12000 [Thermomicrobiales bacterium]